MDQSEFFDYADAYQILRNPLQDQPEALLYKAVLENALLEFYKGNLVDDRRKARLVREAWEWICAEDYAWPLSFVNICSVWELEPGEIRRHLRKHWRKLVEEEAQNSLEQKVLRLLTDTPQAFDDIQRKAGIYRDILRRILRHLVEHEQAVRIQEGHRIYYTRAVCLSAQAA